MLRDYDLFTRLIRTRPLFTAGLLFLLGCILGYALELSPFALVPLALLPLILAFALRKRSRRFAAALVLIAFLPMGMLRFELCWSRTRPLEDRPHAALSGRICDLPEWDPENERTVCTLEEISIDGENVSGRLRLYLRGDTDLLQAVELGQFLRSDAHIWRANEASNYGQFNFSNYLRVHGLRGYATAEIENAELSASELRLSDRLPLLREAIGERIDRLFPRNTGVARALIIGDKSDLSEEERESYSRSGAAHLLAISGMHLSLLANFTSYVLRHFMRRRSAFLLTLALLLLYGFLIGFNASLLRALVMFAVFGFSMLCERYSDAPTRLSAALLVCLLLRPSFILDSGFILSYSATAGIIFLYEPLQRLFHVHGYLAKPTDVGFVSLFTERLPRWIISTLLLSLAAQLALLPAIVHFFGAQPLCSFAINLIATPLTMIGYILSLFATLFQFKPLALAADGCFSLLNASVRFFSESPIASLRIARYPLWLVLLCAVIVFLASDLCRLGKRLRSVLPLLILFTALISSLFPILAARGCSIVFLDAGEADCAVVRTEGKIYLIDAGDAYTPAADYLSAMNYELEGVFLSHCHTDHALGLSKILEICTPKRIYLSENWNHFAVGEEVSAVIEKAVRRGSQLVALSVGDKISLSDKTLLQVLSPSAGFSTTLANEDSLILRIEYGQSSAMFCGDAPASIVSGKVGDIDLLKVAHHGANDSVNAALLAELTPSVAVIPVGRNAYAHPSADALSLFEVAGAQVWRTDLHGAVSCRLKQEGGVVVRPYQAPEVANGLE